MPKLIDVHTHVSFPAYDKEGHGVAKKALDEGIWLVNVGTNIKTSKEAVEFAKKYEEGVYATVGLHPNNTYPNHHDENELGKSDNKRHGGEDFDYQAYKDLAVDEGVVAIGEFGLDYFRGGDDTKREQEKAFQAQIDLAKELELPLMIHCRDAFEDLIDGLRSRKNDLKSDYPGIIHFFTGTEENAKDLVDLGFYFSFGGVITFTDDYDDAIREIGLGRILLETDAPYVAPVPHRGKRNEPAFVVHTAERLADLLGEDLKKIEKRTTENARKVLSI